MGLKLNLGCGTRTHAEWVNIDYSFKLRLSNIPCVRRFVNCPAGIMIHDLRKGIPFADATVDVVYASHVLEHLQRHHARQFLGEMYRVMKPGGTVRIVVPDLEFAARKYLDALEAVRGNGGGTPEDSLRHEWATIYLLDQLVRTECGGEMTVWLRTHRDSPVVADMAGILRTIAADDGQQGKLKRLLLAALALFNLRNPARTGELHRWMYDELSLAALLRDAEFNEIQRVNHLESRIPGWASFGLDNNRDDSPHQPGSIWIEASK